MSDSFLREDCVLVTLGDDPIPWASARGGAIEGYRRYSDVTLTRLRRDSSPPVLMGWADRVGQPTTVTLAHLSPNGNTTGNGLRYEGTLIRLQLADYDANSNGVAIDRAIVRPYSVKALNG